jgi:regulator of nucleoside diphosphate kinase
MQHQAVLVTDFDIRLLNSLVEGPRSRDQHEAGSVESLERHLDKAEILPAVRIGPSVVTMNSEIRVSDLETHETIVFRVVFPRAADSATGKISVLAPLGMAVLGRREGDQITCQTPGGLRRLRVDRVLYQPEREGVDSISRPSSRFNQDRRRI